MRHRVVSVLFVSLFQVLIAQSPALATHPHDEGVACGKGRVNRLHISRDGEVWVCRYNEQIDWYFWDPIPPADPEGAEVDQGGQLSFAGGNDYHFLLSRTEWIRGQLKTGSDTYVRSPYWSPLYRSAGQIAVFSRLWNWTGYSWNICRDSGWSFTTIFSESRVPTFNWGSSPCGAGYYGNEAFGAHLRDGSWRVSGPAWSGYLYVSGSLLRASDDSALGTNDAATATPPDRQPPKSTAPKPGSVDQPRSTSESPSSVSARG